MEQLLTRWGKELNKELPLNDYPRPQMARDSFINLNGLWDYAIQKKDDPFDWEGQIVVPFSPETILSGVNRTVTPNDRLYYRRTFTYNKTNDRALLHFGAVDYECEVTLNGVALGSHRGGYYPFTFDVTEEIREGENELLVSVTDPSETGPQASGKQTSKRGQIWYTPQSGIWQTVWLEEVPENYIVSVKLTPDIDTNVLKAEIFFFGERKHVTFTVYDKGEKRTSVTTSGRCASIAMGDYRLWSPEDPYLYDLEVTCGADRVMCYFGMRKFSVGKDGKGVSRLMLNNKPYFHNGLLDQGYWSDGLYTAPSDEAMIYDIQTMKEMGFNMLRKHIKVESLRWYYHCDRLGMLVWQDMVNGGAPVKQFVVAALPGLQMAFNTKHAGRLDDGPDNYRLFSRGDRKGREEYYVDAKRMIDELYNCVSLCLWVPFNEGWGQFDAAKAFAFFRENDPTRIIDHASGWHDQGKGDLNSFHIYFTPFWFPKMDKKDDRVIALTEFGGFSMVTPGHVFNTEKTFGYRIYKKKEDLEKALKHLYLDRIAPLIEKRGLSALVYTEVSDVEDETNGFLTFDREVVKVDMELMKEINGKIGFAE